MARTAASLAVFLAIAFVLLGGSANGPLASAEAKKGENGNGNGNGPPVTLPEQAQGLPAAPEAIAPEPTAIEQASSSGPPADTPGNGPPEHAGGGSGKADPPDPVEPISPPTSETPEQPGNSANGNGSPNPTGGRPNVDPPEPPNGTPNDPPGAEDPPAQGVVDTPDAPVNEPIVETGSGGQAKGETPRIIGSPPVTIPPGDSGTGAVLGQSAAAATIAPAAAVTPAAELDDSSGDSQPGGSDTDRGSGAEEQTEGFAPAVFGDLPQLLEFVPDSVKAALAGLAALSILLGLGYILSAVRNRRLERQRGELLQEVGLLQSALLPPVPERVGSLQTSVAYRPADGPGAGGDFYDVLPLPGGRVGFILGDVSGHGRGALARTAFMRYTLRAYLEAGLEPRVALQVAGRVIDENLGGDFATVLLAVHDPETGSLTYASAGHPAPLVVGPEPHDPVTAGSSPPIGVGVRTGLRQTTVPLVPGSVACLFTDGLMEARVQGGILGRERLEELLDALGSEATAAGLIDSVKTEARVLSDDIAAVVIQPTNGVTAGLFRTEQLELTARELDGPVAERFLASCGIAPVEVEAAVYDARTLAERFGGVILHVVFGNRLRVEVLPRNVESIEAASRRAAASR